MKFHASVISAIMHTQFSKLKLVNGTAASTAEEHYPFRPDEVEEVYFGKNSFDKGVWFRLKDGRLFDVRGPVPQQGTGGQQDRAANIVMQRPGNDWDSIDKLPLSPVPLSAVSLRQSRLVKNVRLETMLELHEGAASGSLQIHPEDITRTFPGHAADQRIICRLAKFHSFDVYSLRINLARLGVHVDSTALDLSEPMKESLERYSSEFTTPLVRAIFGADGHDIADRQSLIRVFRDPDKAHVAQRLKAMSEKTGIPVADLPKFLEAYSDAFLSVAYYRHSFEGVTPNLERCSFWLRDLRGARDANMTPQAAARCEKVEESLNYLANATRERLKAFRAAFDMFWRDMNRETFARLRGDIEGRQEGIGAMLCGLIVKMRHWSQTFHHHESGGPGTRIQYLMSEMEPGLDQLCRLHI